jgi:hypothetical protein
VITGLGGDGAEQRLALLRALTTTAFEQVFKTNRSTT